MINDIIEIVLKIPGLIEFLIALFITSIFRKVAREILKETAQTTVCNMGGFYNWLLCMSMTHMGIIVIIITAIGLALRF